MRFYIDPGTGSMLFTVLIGVLGASAYFLRNSFIKLRFYLSGGKAEKEAGERVPSPCLPTANGTGTSSSRSAMRSRRAGNRCFI